MTRYLDLEVVSSELASLGFRVRDYGLLGSALSRPRTTLFGVDAYPTVSLKGASLIESIIQHHVLFDGNKRAAWYLLVVFMLLNNFEINAKSSSVVKLMSDISRKEIELEEIARWISERSIPTKKS